MPSTPCSVGKLQSRVTPTFVGVQVTGDAQPLHHHLWPHSQGLPGALKGLLPCPVQAQLSPWVGCHCSPSPYFLQGLLIFTFCLLCGNHQLWIWGTRGTVQVLDRVTDVFLDPMEEVILEVLLGLQVCHPPRAFGVGSDCGSLPTSWQRRGPSHYYPGWQILYENVKGGHHAKNNGRFLHDMDNGSCGPHVPAHICCCPFNDWMILSWTTAFR